MVSIMILRLSAKLNTDHNQICFQLTISRVFECIYSTLFNLRGSHSI